MCPPVMQRMCWRGGRSSIFPSSNRYEFSSCLRMYYLGYRLFYDYIHVPDERCVIPAKAGWRQLDCLGCQSPRPLAGVGLGEGGGNWNKFIKKEAGEPCLADRWPG